MKTIYILAICTPLIMMIQGKDSFEGQLINAAVGWGGWGGCLCTEEYNPVCGTDGEIYSNQCKLDCASQHNPGLTCQCVGECPCPELNKEPCFCTADYRPVCGSDNETYGNGCNLMCERKANQPCLRCACGGECPCLPSSPSC